MFKKLVSKKIQAQDPVLAVLLRARLKPMISTSSDRMRVSFRILDEKQYSKMLTILLSVYRNYIARTKARELI